MKLSIALALVLLSPAQHRPSRPVAHGSHSVAGEARAFPIEVPQGGDLQAALNKGGEVRLKAGATYPGTFTLRSGTTLVGNGATLTGTRTGPALDIPIRTHDVSVFDLSAGTAYDQSVIRVGRNDRSQNAPDLAPDRVTFTRVRVDSYRGKRAFEINGRDVSLIDCVVADTFDPAGRDSQAVGILNAPGPVLVQGGSYSAGSEVIMVGGDTMKMPDVVPTGITITDTKLWRPLEWQTDGVSRGIKNLLELKTGRQVNVRNVTMDGSWKNAQDGWAIVITPRSGGDIHDVLIEDVTIDHVGGGFNILGADGSTVTPSPVSNLVVRRAKITATSKVYGGRGILALITGAPHDVTFDSNTAITDGNCIVLVEKSGSALQADGTKRPAGNVARLVITNNRLVAGTYGLFLSGHVAGERWQDSVDELTFTGNTIAGASAKLKKNMPDNTYVDRSRFDALIAAGE